MTYLRKLLMQKKKDEYIIEYTSTDGNIVEPYSGATTPFIDASGNNISIVSNTYENGKGIIKLEKECKQIGTQAFYECSTLASIAIPDLVTSIGNSAFNSCDSLISINIPNLVSIINDLTFCYCYSLTGVTIPESVASIGRGAFMYCSDLINLTILSKDPPTLDASAFIRIASDVNIYVPSGSVDAYKTAIIWKNYADQIQAIPE